MGSASSVGVTASGSVVVGRGGVTENVVNGRVTSGHMSSVTASGRVVSVSVGSGSAVE